MTIVIIEFIPWTLRLLDSNLYLERPLLNPSNAATAQNMFGMSFLEWLSKPIFWPWKVVAQSLLLNCFQIYYLGLL